MDDGWEEYSEMERDGKRGWDWRSKSRVPEEWEGEDIYARLVAPCPGATPAIARGEARQEQRRSRPEHGDGSCQMNRCGKCHERLPDGNPAMASTFPLCSLDTGTVLSRVFACVVRISGFSLPIQESQLRR